MLSNRNRYFSPEANQILPWGDPYILQVFETLLADQDSQDEQLAEPVYYTEHLRIRGTAPPPLSYPHADFELPRRDVANLPLEEPSEEE